MLLGQVLQHGLVHALGLDERRVGLDDDVALLEPLDDVLSGAPGVDLVLADIDLTADSAVDVRLELIQVLHAVVGDTDGADLSGLLCLHQGSPGALTVCLRAARGVDQHPTPVSAIPEPDVGSSERNLQVNVVEPGVLQRRLNSSLGLLVSHRSDGDLGGVEDLGAVDTGVSDGVGAFSLVLVVLGGIDLADCEKLSKASNVVDQPTWRYPTSMALRVTFSVISGGVW